MPLNYDFGGVPRSVSVGTSSVVISPPNRRRRRIVIVNDSDTTIYVAKGSTAALNAGIRLSANGGSLTDESDMFGYIYSGPWSAISSAASKNLCVNEE